LGEEEIPFGKPRLDQAERDMVAHVLSGSTLVHGAITREFEEAFADRIGVNHAVSVSSCTAGMHLSLLAMGIGPDDEVIVPAMTHVATAHAVEYTGARPIFCDVHANTGNINSGLLEASINQKTKAVMPVHYLGLPCDMGAIAKCCESRSLFVLEDCALAIDATYDGKKAGSLGKAGAFSFYPVKHMTTIEGGMVTSDDAHIADSIRKLRAFGYDRPLGQRARPGIYDVDSLGYNYRMNEVEAAVGLAQLKKLDGMQSTRKENYNRLYELLTDVEELVVFSPQQGKSMSSHYCLNATLPKNRSINRDRVVECLKNAGVGSSVHYPSAVPLFSYYQGKYGYKEGQFPVAEWLAEQTISLPVGPHLPENGPERIAHALKEAIVRSKEAD